MRTRTAALAAATLLATALAPAACVPGSPTAGETPPARRATGPPPLPVGAEVVDLRASDFVATIDNPYWPLTRGTRWVYRETGPRGAVRRVEVTVTGRTRRILGIRATIVHDVVSADGTVEEDTFDWYVQDRWGNVWYLGEDTREYEDGRVVSTEGSWEAGVDGAQPGVIIPARPRPGLAYRQEHYAGHAEDAARVLTLEGRVRVPAGSFDHVLVTAEVTPLEPGLVEHKFYARGVGPVLAITVSGGSDREELVRFRRG